MSDSTKLMNFGQAPTEPEKNRWVFGLRVKIEPYLKVQSDRRASPKKAEKPDRFSVEISTPKYEP
ncbi:hypothetical protein [Hyalangium rubrum]|uniref:Uncharacterized protein n=1 Tax=Hyalangium rubrum TaxID=3103134 RepID=A0ABU5HFJ3_9BACT|nr:hypothetical protein [Hyalangium sp. s54d21]MDY7232251.1 hypothetical protein [Hyalangium sp. s54d21]